MASNIYGSYEEQESKVNSAEEEVYYEDDLEKKHLYKEIEFAVDVEDSVVYIIFWLIRFYGSLSCYY